MADRLAWWLAAAVELGVGLGLGFGFGGCNRSGRDARSPFAPPPPTVAGGGGGGGSGGSSGGANAGGPSGGTATPTAATPVPKPVIKRGRGSWQRIAAPPRTPVGREPARGLAVGRELLGHHPTDGWLASYDPCTKEWQQHEDLPQPLRRVPPLAVDATHASFCCGPPDVSGLLVDVGATKPRAIPSMPRTPYPGRTHQVLADGFLVPIDKRFVTRTATWRVVAFDDAVYEAAGRQGSAWTSGGMFALAFGGGGYDAAAGGNVLAPGGAVFDGRKDAWRTVAEAGAPSPRMEAAAVWTGAELLVYGGQGKAADGTTMVTLTDGGRYDPMRDRWTSIRGGPVFEGHADAMMAGDTVLLWDASRGAAYDLRTGSWRELGLPAKVAIQDRAFGHGRIAVVTDDEAFVLDPATLAWARTALPKALRGRNQRVQVMTSSHLVVWAGESITGSGGCENPPPNQGCDPWVETKPAFDGAALRLGSCR